MRLLSEFEEAYARSYASKLIGNVVDSQTAFEQAKSAAVRALQQGATTDQLADVMHRCRVAR